MLTGLVFEILVYLITIEIAILLGVRLTIEVLALIKTRPVNPLEILAKIPTLSSGENMGQFAMSEDEGDYTVDQRLWVQEQGAKTDKEISTLLKETEGIE